MTYFDTLQGYMSNMNEAQDHEMSMNKEQQDRKEKTLEDKFNSISSQAEGWGQALTQVGVAWKMGNKVAKNAKEIAGKVKDAAGKVKDAAQGKTGTTEESTANVKPSGAGETATSEGDLVPLSKTPVRDAIQQKIRDNQTKASEDSTPSGGQSGGGAPAQPTSASDVPPSADGIKVPSQNKLGKRRIEPEDDDEPNGGAAPPSLSESGISAPLQNAQSFQSNTSDNLANIIHPKANSGTAGDGAGGGGGQAATLADNVGTSAATDVNAMGTSAAAAVSDTLNVASRAAGATTAAATEGLTGLTGAATAATTAATGVAKVAAEGAMDVMPVIGEAVGIATIIGGLIHGLHKGGMMDKMAKIQESGGETARGGLDIGALKGAQTIQGQVRA
jgi:hypothetical protein